MLDDVDFYWPTLDYGLWVNGDRARDQVDGTYAAITTTQDHNYYTFNDPAPGTDAIKGIEVKLELSGTTAAGSVDVLLSWNGDSNFTAAKTIASIPTTDTVFTLGGPSDTWGRTWTADELSNANFRVRISGTPSANTLQLDAIQVKVYHQASGGGVGGGGAI
jgi:hypothetical protein